MVERLFIAVEIPQEIKELFVPITSELKKAKSKVVPMENIHLTLKFIGETYKRESIIKVLSNCSKKKFTLKLKGVGVFPNVSHPRVFWVGVEENKELEELFSFIEDSLFSIGIPKDERPFSPHVTLSRFKFSPIHGLGKIIDEYKNFDFGTYEVREFFLFKSELREPSPIYTKLYSFPLV
jgi:2'-5' RNA ligase